MVVDRIDNDLSGRRVPHLSTGLLDLDRLIGGGLRRKSMVVIAGRPGEGKTTLGLQKIAQSIVLSGSGVGLVFSLEMTKEELTTRGIASVGSIDLRRLDDAALLTDDDWPRITAAVGKLNPVELYLCDRPGLTVVRIRSIARQVQRQHGLDVLVVDYIGLIATSGRAGNRAEAIGAVSTSLKNLSKELGIPVLVLAQLNRESTKRTGKSRRPQASDLRDSGQIEQARDWKTSQKTS
ncbi:AAA family ATPase [Pseudomonas sp. ABC1]|uniref:DnaB-like helicase C-terminal domain-containing protein n=1 Tax=Pseudomonas sp. ABC1 TaxID=2748080 RepID=UPI0015C38F99|nr:DnaB-like helicase C-terminal domain-containing protein [Pseudomonas sp. ABC1]QLF92282.1 AAA family ATPase [Pseudomonas sp. ABC1]